MADVSGQEVQRSKRKFPFVSILNRAGVGFVFFFLLSLAITVFSSENLLVAQGILEEGDGKTPAFTNERELRSQAADFGKTAENRPTEQSESVDTPGGVSKRALVAFICALVALIFYLLYVIASRRTTAHEGQGNGFPESAGGSNRPTARLESDTELPVAAHKLTVLGTLAPGVTHVLNNRINNIGLTADLLLEDYKDLSDAERLDMVNDLVKESEKAHEVIRNLSDFIREGGTNPEPHDITSIVEDTLRLADNHIRRAKVKVRGELSPNLPRVSCVRWKIEHAFLSILLNAIDAMPGGGTLTISCDIARDSDFVSVEFIDEGSGIPEEHISDIFTPSFTTKPPTLALGLGLPVSLKIAREHGGDIKVKSQLGKGTTVTVSLPLG